MAGRQSRASTTRFLIGPCQEQIPVAKLPNTEAVLQVISHYRLLPACKSKPVIDFCCGLKKDKSSFCLDDDGCVAKQEPCLLFKVKERYLQAGIVTVSDERIRIKLKETQDYYNSIYRERDRQTAGAVKKRDAYREVLKKTFNIVDPNARHHITNDTKRDDAARIEDLRFFDDYFGKILLLLFLLNYLYDSSIQVTRQQERLG